ncbi:AAA family ATPase [Limnothrix sp. FACHB-1083]|uniref:P-loop ATPase, Sll1717 family n=1 Tax=unclassified Limnothrix TaxID=2632864 RepID=UPI001680F8C4|nr:MULTISPECIES: AAA family ATPase [unclassified Limnothrix]MBD2161633.1 AAA family ATPase [Limnothrix sp. FACHB-1083]MBD2192346.1 AAA family ATPase [Limnothrix sp. FACHB-1088]
MNTNWIFDLKSELEKNYIRHPETEWLDLTISSDGFIDLTIVSDHFQDLSHQSRQDIVQKLVQRTTGFLSLYTVEEAKVLEMERPAPARSEQVRTWHDLAMWAQNPQNHGEVKERSPRSPRTVAFYSFKGGVGRTTALIHVAWLLVKQGKKVVVVDLDIEAPGLSKALDLDDSPEVGIVDYFYERAYAPDGANYEIQIGDILAEYRDQQLGDTRGGRFFVVPTGKLDLDYLAKVDDLKASTWVNGNESLWDVFTRDIKKQIEPDLILVDSRTGLNQWGAFSLVQAADSAILVLFPNAQNAEGAKILVQALGSLGKQNINFVFSPIPNSDSKAIAQSIQLDLNEIINQFIPPASSDEPDDEDLASSDDLICIEYLLPIAVAPHYPVHSVLDWYQPIANLISKDSTSLPVSTQLQRDRWKIIEDLQFSNVDATQEQATLSNIFQKTSNFYDFLDDRVCLVTGRKGTGKTALYFLFLKHFAFAQKLTDRLNKTTILSGHGMLSSGRPTESEFDFIRTDLSNSQTSWLGFWASYALFRIMADHSQSSISLRKDKYKPLKDSFGTVKNLQFGSEHQDLLLQWSQSRELRPLIFDALKDIDNYLKKQDQKIWLLYDNLDQDLAEANNLRNDALTGLFKLVQELDAKELTNLRIKIFLREDIWERLIFDNRSHLRGRSIKLEWKRVDLLRFAYRQVTQSEKFKALVSQVAPIPDPDSATEETLVEALKILWGDRIRLGSRGKYLYRWVYDRLSDTSDATYPRSLVVLLTEAKKLELQHKNDPKLQSDRLFRSRFMADALEEASRARCQEMREEYGNLSAFFDSLSGKDALLQPQELRQCWENSAREVEPDFERFVQLLKSIGLAEWRPKDERYRFADLYVYGFNMNKKGMR